MNDFLKMENQKNLLKIKDLIWFGLVQQIWFDAADLIFGLVQQIWFDAADLIFGLVQLI